MPAVRSADRTLSLFETFEAQRKPLVLSELADQMGIPISSCHGLVQTLIQRGFLYSLGSRKAIYPTRRVLLLAEAIVRNDPMLLRVEPILQSLRDSTGETVILGKRQGEAILYLVVVEGLHSVRYTALPGDYKPLHSSSIGKALLGSLSPEALMAWLDKHPLPKVTEATLTSRAAFEKDIETSRKRGYFITRGEHVVDVSGVAAPVLLNNERFAVSVAGPRQRIEANEESVARHLLETRQQLETRLG